MTEILRLTAAEIRQRDIETEVAAGLLPGQLKPGASSPGQSAVSGLDGHFFIGMGSNNWERHYEGRVNIAAEWFDAWNALHAARRAEASRRGVTLWNVVVPEKQVVMPEARWREPPSAEQRPFLQLIRRLPPDLALYYPLADLQTAKADAPMYFRRNSHWTPSGCLVAVRGLADRLGADVAFDTLRFAYRIRRLGHDLPPHFYEQPPEVDAGELTANGDYLFEHHALQITGRLVGSRYAISNPEAPDPRRVIIFGDSFSYDAGLATALSAIFAEVAFFWSKNVLWRLVDERSADIVICESAERFIVTLPDS